MVYYKTIYLCTQLSRETSDDDMQKVFTRAQMGTDPTALLQGDSAASNTPVKFSRIFHAATSGPTRTANVLAGQIGDQQSNEQRFYVTNKGAKKGDSVIPTREDLRDFIQAGDVITFDIPDGMPEDDPEASKYVPMTVEHVYKESVEIEGGLTHKVSGKMAFFISNYSRAVQTNNLDISARLKGTVGFMRHQLDGSVFVMTKGDLTKIIPLFFNQDPFLATDSTTQSVESKQATVLVNLLKTHPRPWCLRLSFPNDDTYLPNAELACVYSLSGVAYPIKTPSSSAVFFFFLLFFLVLGVGVGLFVFQDHPSIKPAIQPLVQAAAPHLLQLKESLQPLFEPLLEHFEHVGSLFVDLTNGKT